MTKCFIVAAALSFLSLFYGTTICAENAGPCAGDIARFCNNIDSGGGRIIQCLIEHEKDLTPPCMARTKVIMMRAKEVRNGCADDIDKFCDDVQPGRSNMMRCLNMHRHELSSVCMDELRKLKRRID